MSIIIPANSASGGGGFGVANSLRFNRGSSDYLRWNSSPSGNRQKFTWSAWFKRSSFGATQILASASYSGGDEGYLFLSSGGVLGWQSTNGGDGNLTTARFFKDTSAWYHVVFSVDTTQGTATNRIKLYINGEQYTWDGNTTQPNQNQSLYWNVGDTYYPYIGRRNGGDYFDGYMAEIVQVNNAQLAADSFGEFDEDSGIWKPIDVSGLTFGDTGYYLNFQDSSALGNDVSGENHDWTSYNLAAIDQTTDTCTNNFATINPLDNFYTPHSLSEGNLKQTTDSTSGYAPNVSTFALDEGKWYFEVKYVSRSSSDNYNLIGIKGSQVINTNFLGQNNYEYGYYSQSGQYYNNNSGNSYGASYDQGDIIGCYLDLDNNKLYFAKNGALQNSGTGISITDPASTPSGYYFFAAGDYGGSLTIVNEWNFGNPLFTGTDKSDANGYGSFEYDPSVGTFDGASKNFYALNTKNLAEYG